MLTAPSAPGSVRTSCSLAARHLEPKAAVSLMTDVVVCQPTAARVSIPMGARADRSDARGAGAGAGGVDFFISYTGADRQWAEWIAWQFEETGYVARIQAWGLRC